LWEFCRDGHSDSAIFPISEGKIREVIYRGCNPDSQEAHDHPCVIAIIDGRERIEASVCLDSAQPWYSDEWLWQDKWIHVHYLHRRSRHIYRLMQFVHWWHEQTGSVVAFGIETRTDLARKYRFYRRHGVCLGAAFALGLKEGDGRIPDVLD
jgi:hypothetical protein